MKQVAIAMLIVTALAAASGGLYGLRIASPGVEHPDKEAAAEQKAPGVSPDANSRLLDLPAVVTNLGSPQETWIRLEASLLFDPKATPQPDALGAEIAGDILAFLRTTSLSQIQGPAGLQNLRDDLNERVAIRSGGAAKELVIRTLVVQ
ncbi:MAG: flagellar basal body-associated FliL family protein [Roseiarcus sp.]